MARLLPAFFLALFALLGLAAAQGPASLPDCAKNCATTASNAAGCTLTDIPCLCSRPSFVSATLQCSRSACGVEDQSSASGVLEEMCASMPPPGQNTTTTTTTAPSSTRPAPFTSPTPTSSPTAPSPRPQNPPQTPTPAPVTTTVHDGTTTLTGASTPGTTLIPATGNVTTVVMSTITGPAPTGNAAGGLGVRAGWWSGVFVVFGLVAL